MLGRSGFPVRSPKSARPDPTADADADSAVPDLSASAREELARALDVQSHHLRSRRGSVLEGCFHPVPAAALATSHAWRSIRSEMALVSCRCCRPKRWKPTAARWSDMRVTRSSRCSRETNVMDYPAVGRGRTPRTGKWASRPAAERQEG